MVEESVRRLKTLEVWASAVAEFVRDMSLAEWSLLVAVVALLVSIGALWYTRRQTKLDEEQAEQRPELGAGKVEREGQGAER